MNPVMQMLGVPENHHPLRDAFMGWQCRVRQLAMRENMGRPHDAIRPQLTVTGDDGFSCRVTTVICRVAPYSRTPELRHMVKRTFDPAQRREKAIQFFSETYYQKHREFSDTLTATFPPGSQTAARILAAGECTLTFDAYAHRFDLECSVERLEGSDPHHQATWTHNLLFNPDLHPETVILAFRPDWQASTANTAP